MRQQVQMPASASYRPGAVHDARPEETRGDLRAFYSHDEEGLVYRIVQSDEGAYRVLSMYPILIGEDFPSGRLVSRRRIDLGQVIEDVLRDGPLEEDEVLRRANLLSRERISAVIFEMAASLVGDRKQDRGPSLADAIDQVWEDDEDLPTVKDLVEHLNAKYGIAYSDASVKSALSRGPFISDGRRPARWARVRQVHR